MALARLPAWARRGAQRRTLGCARHRGGSTSPHAPATRAPAAAPRTPPRAALSGHPVVYHPDFSIQPLPDGHRFPMPKDHLLYLRLCELGLATPSNTFTPQPPDGDTLALCHCPEYVQAFLSGAIDAAAMRRIGLPWSERLVRRTTLGVGSAVLAARLALQYGVAAMSNGGTHHAHRAHGSGWCIFNDLGVAARAIQRDAGVGRVLILDLDVHHGDGTAAIFAGDDSVFTFSLHCDDQAFPQQRPPSDRDVGLRAGAGDAEYAAALAQHVPAIFDEIRPDLVLYNAGVDPHADDALGLLKLSDAGLAARDAAVFDACGERGVPIAAAIGGGYAVDHSAIVERHVSMHAAAAAAFRCYGGRYAEAQAAKRAARRAARLAAAAAAAPS